MTTDTMYNGWTNWETWHVALLADNTENVYHHAMALAERCANIRAGLVKNKTFNPQQAADAFKSALAPQWRETRDFALANAREFGGGQIEPMGTVNWLEVAEHFMASADENRA